MSLTVHFLKNRSAKGRYPLNPTPWFRLGEGDFPIPISDHGSGYSILSSYERDSLLISQAHDRSFGILNSPSLQATEERFPFVIFNSIFVIINNPIICNAITLFVCLFVFVSFSSYTGLACFPASDPIPGKSCAITGWGTLKSGGEQPDKLQVAHVPIVRQDDCKKLYKNQIHDSMVCAGYPEGGKDSCQGDSGGPMVCKGTDGRYSVHGVTSWGYGCAEPNKPGVYARVSYLLKWIKDKINSN